MLQRHDIATLATNLYCDFQTGHEEEFVDLVYERVEGVPTSSAVGKLGEELLRLVGGEVSCMVVRNLPHSNHTQPTPERYQPPVSADVHLQDVAPLVLYALSGLRARGYAESRGGRVLNDVMPRPGFEAKANSAFGAEKTFEWHADLAYTPDNRPQFVGMYCMRNDERAATEFIDPAAVIKAPDLINELAKSQFNIHYGSKDPGAIRLKNVPIYSGGKVAWSLYTDSTSDTVGGSDALDAAHSLSDHATDEQKASVILQQGELVMWDNSGLLHRRLPFTPAEVISERRWLRRAYLYTS